MATLEIDGQEVESKQRDWATRRRVGDNFTISFDGLPNVDPILECLDTRDHVYAQILSDTRVRAAVRQRKAKITGMEWKIQGENTPEEQIEVLTDLFTSYNMRNVISQVLNAPGFGYQVFEINWGMIDGLLLPVDLIAKPNHWFRYNDKNQLMFRPINGQLKKLPRNKFIVATNEPTYENPYGWGYLSTCFWPVTFRKNGWAGWSIFAEKYGMPLPIVRGDESTQQSEIDDAADAVASAVQDAVISLPKNFEVDVVEAARGGDSVHSKFIDAANTDIAIAVLGTNLTMEIKSGSLAAAEVSRDVAEDQVESDEKLTEEFLNELLGKIYQLNWSSDQCPVFDLFAEEDIDKERSERDKNLLDSNPNLRLNKIYYQKNYKLDDEDFDIVDSQENGGE